MNNKQIVREIIDAFFLGDIEKALSFMTDDAQMEWPGAFALQPGKDVIRQFMQTMPEIIASSVGDIVEDGDTVAGTGMLVTKFPDGEVKTSHFCDVYKFTEGKVMSISSYMIFEQDPDE